MQTKTGHIQSKSISQKIDIGPPLHLLQNSITLISLPQGNELEEEPPEALSMSWPKTTRKRITYLLVAPILFPLYLTLPDTRTPRGKRFYPVTFIGSIAWIAAYSYLMVWWANVAGDTAKIPPEVGSTRYCCSPTLFQPDPLCR